MFHSFASEQEMLKLWYNSIWNTTWHALFVFLIKHLANPHSNMDTCNCECTSASPLLQMTPTFLETHRQTSHLSNADGISYQKGPKCLQRGFNIFIDMLKLKNRWNKGSVCQTRTRSTVKFSCNSALNSYWKIFLSPSDVLCTYH